MSVSDVFERPFDNHWATISCVTDVVDPKPTTEEPGKPA